MFEFGQIYNIEHNRGNIKYLKTFQQLFIYEIRRVTNFLLFFFCRLSIIRG